MVQTDVTQLLRAWTDGDIEARDQLIALIYPELRARAAAQLVRERQGHILQPTALVHETYLRLVCQDSAAWKNRSQFFGVASEMMRRILVDHARAHRAAKRSGQWARVTLDPALAAAGPPDVNVLDLDFALTRLSAHDARKSRIAELRLFAGLSVRETAEIVGISRATAERDWQFARAWLLNELSRLKTP